MIIYIFLIQESNHISCISCIGRWILYHQSYLGSPCIYMALSIMYHYHHHDNHYYPELDCELIRDRVVPLSIHHSTTIHSGLIVYQSFSGDLKRRRLTKFLISWSL